MAPPRVLGMSPPLSWCWLRAGPSDGRSPWVTSLPPSWPAALEKSHLWMVYRVLLPGKGFRHAEPWAGVWEPGQPPGRWATLLLGLRTRGSNAFLLEPPSTQASRLFITQGIICWYQLAAFLSQVACVISKRMKGNFKKKREKGSFCKWFIFWRCHGSCKHFWNPEAFRPGPYCSNRVSLRQGGRACLWAVTLKAQNSNTPFRHCV